MLQTHDADKFIIFYKPVPLIIPLLYPKMSTYMKQSCPHIKPRYRITKTPSHSKLYQIKLVIKILKLLHLTTNITNLAYKNKREDHLRDFQQRYLKALGVRMIQRSKGRSRGIL